LSSLALHVVECTLYLVFESHPLRQLAENKQVKVILEITPTPTRRACFIFGMSDMQFAQPKCVLLRDADSFGISFSIGEGKISRPSQLTNNEGALAEKTVD
jgi:hypothetical protein